MADVREYAFDIKMFAIVRMNASNEAAARSALGRLLDADLKVRFSEREATITSAEAPLYVDDELGPYLFEIDGQTVYGSPNF